MSELHKWSDDELLYLTIQNCNGLDIVKERRVDLFYLTNQNNKARKEEVKDVMCHSLSSSLWIGEASDYMGFR